MNKKKRRIENIGFKTLAVSSLLFFILIFSLVKLNLITPLDNQINSSISLLYNPLADSILFFIVTITSTINSIIMGIIFTAVLLAIKKEREAIIFLLAVLSAFLLEYLAKIAIKVARPENALIEISEYGFPSGHATISALIFTLLIYAFKDDIKNKILRYSFVIICILLTLLIGFSRLYMRVHWLSDVLGGFILGIFCFALFASYLHKSKAKNWHS